MTNSLKFRQKLASLGGMPEKSFEQSFAQLAFAYLQDKAPGLLPHMKGFQLVERNAENTKALGIFGFQLGPEWVYAPVFFINGDLKGHQLLYLKNRDAFIPLKENWVNYLLSKSPSVLGKGVPDSPQSIGLKQPDLESMVRPPIFGKYSSADIPRLPHAWVEAVKPALAHAAFRDPNTLTKFAGLSDALDLRALLAEDFNSLRTLSAWQNEMPWLKTACANFYASDLLIKSAKALQAKEAAAPPAAVAKTVVRTKRASADPKVILVTRNAVESNPFWYDDETKVAAMADGFAFIDKRAEDEKSQAYKTDVSSSLTSPNETGIYQVMTKSGKYIDLVVIVNALGGEKAGTCTVFRPEGSSEATLNVHTSFILAKQSSGDVEDEPAEKFKKWVKSKGSDSPEVDSVYVIATEDGIGTCPITICDDTELKGKQWRARADGWVASKYRNRNETHTGSPCIAYSNDGEVEFVLKTEKEDGTLKLASNTVLCPTGAKFFKIRKNETGMCCDSSNPAGGSIDLGDLNDFRRNLFDKTASLKIVADLGDYFVNSDKPLSKLAALQRLVMDFGFAVPAATEMLKRAEVSQSFRCRFKLAGPYDDTEGYGAPAIPEALQSYDPGMGRGTMVQQPEHHELPVDSMWEQQAEPGSQTLGPDDMEEQTAQTVYQAGQSGQKEVFDSAMIGALLRSGGRAGLVDKYIPDLQRAIDRVGRILFMFYWHNDNFIDRYGKQDMPELEDTITNALETIGDLTLFLKQRTIDPDPGATLGSPDIEDAAQQ